MQGIEIFGFALALIHLTIVIIFGYFPPNTQRPALGDKTRWQKFLWYLWNIHTLYFASLVGISMIFAYLLWGTSRELDTIRAKNEQKDKITTQASATLKAIPAFILDDNCRGVVLTSFALLEKWKSEIPDTFDKAKGLADRATKPLPKDLSDRTAQTEECKNDAHAMRQLLEGLAAQS